MDIPDTMYRQLKSRAAREGSSTRALILKGVRDVLKSERRRAGAPVSLPMTKDTIPLAPSAMFVQTQKRAPLGAENRPPVTRHAEQ